MNGVSKSAVKLHLDKLDTKWVNMYQNLDYIIISTGKWFHKASIIYENDTIIGCHKCPGQNFIELEVEFTYRKVSRVLRGVELSEFRKVMLTALENGVNLKLIDVAILLVLRPDGHPGAYRQFDPFAEGGRNGNSVQNDCLHWCLPGPIEMLGMMCCLEC